MSDKVTDNHLFSTYMHGMVSVSRIQYEPVASVDVDQRGLAMIILSSGEGMELDHLTSLLL